MNAVWFNQLDFASLCRTSRLELARALARMGHHLKVVGRYRHSPPTLSPLAPRPLLLRQHLPDPFGGIFFQLQVLLLAAGAILNSVDLIMVDHFCALTMLPFNLLSRIGLIRTRFILDIRSCPVDMIGTRYRVSRCRYNLAIRLSRFFYDGITTVSNPYRDDVSARFSIRSAEIGVWTSGVAAELFDPVTVDMARVNSLRYTLAPGDMLVIMYHGVLSPYRGLQNVVEAISLLNAERDRQAMFLLLGDGPGQAEIAKLARERGVEDFIKMITAVPHEDVPCYLSICDAGILPYPDIEWLNMNTPLKLLEYMAMEKPVILTDIRAHRAVTDNAKCAIYIEDNSPANIANAIRRLAKQKPLLPTMGKEGRRIVLDKFTWEKQAENLLTYAGRLHRGKSQ
jgi:glycosyltransferase involved in cell wall biosynthesis